MKIISRFSLICVVVFCVSGCDQIQNVKNHFAKDKSINETETTQKKTDQVVSGDFVVRVGNWSMNRSELKERLDALKQVVPDFDVTDKESRKLVVEELVRQQLLIEDAKKAGLDKSKDIQDAVDEFRRTIIVREMARLKTENLSVTESEAQEFYVQNKQVLVEPLQLRVSEIIVSTKEQADAILVDILQGADFAQKARDFSLAQSAENGGDLGVLTEVPFQEMANVLIPLNEGEVSGVFSGPDGYYIVKVTGKSGGNQIPFEDIKEEIIQNQLMQKQQTVILEYIDQLRKSIPVEIKEDLI